MTASTDRLLNFQQIREQHPDWLEAHAIDLDGAISGDYHDDYAAVSHRWCGAGAQARLC